MNYIYEYILYEKRNKTLIFKDVPNCKLYHLFLSMDKANKCKKQKIKINKKQKNNKIIYIYEMKTCEQKTPSPR